MELHGTDPFTWRRIVRRARLGSTVKLVAAILADYASPDGTDVRPGTKRLKLTTELSDRSVRDGLRVLRDVGLIERVFEGSKLGRRGLADEYRLTIPDDLLERVAMLDPDEQELSPAPAAAVRAVDNPVDNPGTAAAGAGDKGGAGSGTSAAGSRTPAGGSKNTGRRCRPPNQAPTKSPTNKNSGCSDRGAELEGTGPVLVAADEASDLDSSDEGTRYAAASGILRRLPDLGAQFMALAQKEAPTAPLKELVIRAAQIAVKGIPA